MRALFGVNEEPTIVFIKEKVCCSVCCSLCCSVLRGLDKSQLLSVPKKMCVAMCVEVLYVFSIKSVPLSLSKKRYFAVCAAVCVAVCFSVLQCYTGFSIKSLPLSLSKKRCVVVCAAVFVGVCCSVLCVFDQEPAIVFSKEKVCCSVCCDVCCSVCCGLLLCFMLLRVCVSPAHIQTYRHTHTNMYKHTHAHMHT